MYTYISQIAKAYSNCKYKNFHDTVLGKLFQLKYLKYNNFGIMHSLSNLIVKKKNTHYK